MSKAREAAARAVMLAYELERMSSADDEAESYPSAIYLDDLSFSSFANAAIDAFLAALSEDGDLVERVERVAGVIYVNTPALHVWNGKTDPETVRDWDEVVRMTGISPVCIDVYNRCCATARAAIAAALKQEAGQ